jgi:hypothetical protein
MTLILLACTGTKESAVESSAPAEGTVTLDFAASAGVRESSVLVDALKGVIYGSLYYAEEVTVTGPVEGATDLDSVELTVDITSTEPSTDTWTSSTLEPRDYLFLGFFDVDGNGAESKDPDAGDPVTLATTNKFTIVEGQATEYTVYFELVYN